MNEWAPREILVRPPLVDTAIADALSKLPEGHSIEARARVTRGIELRLAPAILESEIIARQLGSPEWTAEVEEAEEFLECAIIIDTICPDGRQDPQYTIGAPGTVEIHQRPGAKPETRPSSSKPGARTLMDPDITASLYNTTRRTKARTGSAELVVFGGVHVNSQDPIHGCGGMKIEVGRKQVPADAMRHGAIARYYDDLGDGFFAFDTVAETILNIPSRTFDLTHDIHSQGLITGLRDAYKQFDMTKTLRANLLQMHRNHQIVMTELLDPLFKDRILETFHELFPAETRTNPPFIDPADYNSLASNLIKIGKVARSITQQEEETGFSSFIPDHIMRDATSVAKRALAYTLIRNVVFGRLANIEPGNHPNLEHNESLMVIGKGPNNVKNIAFKLRTPHGLLDDEDMGAIFDLEGIQKDALKNAGANLDDEATIIVVCGYFDPGIFVEAEIEDQKEIVYSRVGNDAARIRNERREDIANGRRVVLGTLVGPQRTFTEIVK